MFFFDSTWINLGDAPLTVATVAPPQSSYQRIKDSGKKLLRRLSPAYHQRCTKVEQAREERARRLDALATGPYFRPFYWNYDGRLDFRDETFSFLFSEHFFEHIFADEAHALFVECFRVLKPNGVMRISVPDADLRTYGPPEPVAFDTATLTSSKRGWPHPEVHKTRWNIYSLDLLARLAGFQVRPIFYCDKDGRYVQAWPERGDSAYPAEVDWEVICNRAYLLRIPDSLVIDAIKMESANHMPLQPGTVLPRADARIAQTAGGPTHRS